MNKKTIIMFLLALVAATGQAQKIKMNEPSFCDYLPLLNANGYVTYSFDTRKLKDTESWSMCKVKNRGMSSTST